MYSGEQLCEGTQRLAEPVSNTTLNICAGVPILISPKYWVWQRQGVRILHQLYKVFRFLNHKMWLVNILMTFNNSFETLHHFYLGKRWMVFVFCIKTWYIEIEIGIEMDLIEILLWTLSQSPTLWCYHHHVSLWRWFTQVDEHCWVSVKCSTSCQGKQCSVLVLSHQGTFFHIFASSIHRLCHILSIL